MSDDVIIECPFCHTPVPEVHSAVCDQCYEDGCPSCIEFCAEHDFNYCPDCGCTYCKDEKEDAK